MTEQEIYKFAKSSAKSAIDQIDAYGDSVASFRENLIDTMSDEGIDNPTIYQNALEIYDEEIARLK